MARVIKELKNFTLSDARDTIVKDALLQAGRVAEQFPRNLRVPAFRKVYKIKFKLASKQLDARQRPEFSDN